MNTVLVIFGHDGLVRSVLPALCHPGPHSTTSSQPGRRMCGLGWGDNKVNAFLPQSNTSSNAFFPRSQRGVDKSSALFLTAEVPAVACPSWVGRNWRKTPCNCEKKMAMASLAHPAQTRVTLGDMYLAPFFLFFSH